MDGPSKRCVIDNTIVLVAHGTGPDTEMAPEIKMIENPFDIRSSLTHTSPKNIPKARFTPTF
jgi:hypothetical protein